MSFVSLFGENLHVIKNFSIASLYDVTGIVTGSNDFIWKFIILGGIGVITYLAGVTVFSKKDLPL